MSEFDYVDNLPHPGHAIMAEDAAYLVGSLAFPSAGENGQDGNLVTARYYRSKLPGAKPLVIVLPIWGIHAYPSNTISAGLRERSAGAINVLQILGEKSLFDRDGLGDAPSEADFLNVLDQMVGGSSVPSSTSGAWWIGRRPSTMSIRTRSPSLQEGQQRALNLGHAEERNQEAAII